MQMGQMESVKGEWDKGNGLREWIPPCGYCKGRRDAAASRPPRLGSNVFRLAVALVHCAWLRNSRKTRCQSLYRSCPVRMSRSFSTQTREVFPLGFARELEPPNRAFTQAGELVCEPELPRTVYGLGLPAIRPCCNKASTCTFWPTEVVVGHDRQSGCGITSNSQRQGSHNRQFAFVIFVGFMLEVGRRGQTLPPDLRDVGGVPWWVVAAYGSSGAGRGFGIERVACETRVC